MKYVLLLLVLACFIGCSSNTTRYVPAEVFDGEWSGTSKAVYSGSDDGPMTTEDYIVFNFDDDSLTYSWLTLPSEASRGQGERALLTQCGSGDFTTTGNKIILGNIAITCERITMRLQDSFDCSFDGTTLVLSQGNIEASEFTEPAYEITLQKSDY